MVHNGIEYGDHAASVRDLRPAQQSAGYEAEEIREVYLKWNEGELNSFLMEISATVLEKKDEENGQPLVDLVLDTAEMKGTGKWAAQNALDIGVPIPTLSVAVEGRILSGYKPERVEAAKVLKGPKGAFTGNREAFVKSLWQGYYLAMLSCYAQGLVMLKVASRDYGYGLKLSEIARIWKGGCIIRARLLDRFAKPTRRTRSWPTCWWIRSSPGW